MGSEMTPPAAHIWSHPRHPLFCFLGFVLVGCFLGGVFLGLHPRHMEVPRLRGESELQLPAYTTATAMRDPNHICSLHHSSRQRGILNPLSEARNPSRILMVTTGVPYR